MSRAWGHPVNTYESIRERVYDAIVRAADAGERAPSIDSLRLALRCNQASIHRAMRDLSAEGRIMRLGADAVWTYRVTATGRETASPRPALFRRGEKRPAVNLRLHADPKLTAIQRNTLSIARQIIREQGRVRITDLARQMGLNDGQAYERLQRIAGRGHLRQMPDKSYIAAEPRAEVPAGTVIREERRPGCPVPVKIIAPALATGALLFGTFLGQGGIALAGGGFQKSSGRR
jgi:hypothetical protein